ncbi:MAG: alpha/beta fold hydrolase [Gemmatimonadales bacterium]|nr:MAG: alpha/beta fold hydrolase [Gemmatimonadales bacterium]
MATAPLRGGAVFCHPHPLHGGTMHTKAVFRGAQALNDAGFHVLRFNFRGVGQSTGSHDDGRGEADDVRAALDWFSSEHSELPLLIGGFSFGSVVGLKVGFEDPRARALLGLGLPVRAWDLSGLADPEARGGRPLLLVQGENDEFGTGQELEAFAESMGPGAAVARIPGADHYFHDRFDELRAAITPFFLEGAGSEPFPVLEGAR